MAEPWNLTVNEWEDVLDKGADYKTLSAQLINNDYLPWSDALIQYTNDSNEILDLGCGRGELSAILAKNGKNTTLFDWSTENLEFCKKLYKALEISGKFIQGDMTQPLPFEDNSFDTVFSCGVLEYFSDNEIHKIISEIKRIARKRIIILVPNAKSVAYRLGKWYMERNNNWHWGGERPFSTLKPYFESTNNIKITEFSVGTNHSLKFFNIPGGRTLQKMIRKIFRLKNHSRPSKLNQGYILITIGEIAQ